MRTCKIEGCDQETRSPKDTLCREHRKKYQQDRARAAHIRMVEWRAKYKLENQLTPRRKLVQL